MPPATRTFPSDISTPISQSSLFAGLRDALTGVFGTNPLKSYIATDQFAVWELLGDTKTFGRAFYRLRVTSTLAVTHAIGATWTDSTNTLGNPSGEVQSMIYASGTPVRLLGFATNDYKFLLNVQGTTPQLLGWFRPTAPNFDESSYPRFFIPSNSDLTTCVCTGLSPYGSTISFTTQLGQTQFGGPDTFSQTRSAAQGFWIYAPSNTGVLGQASEDLALGACTGMARGDTFLDATDSTKQYFVTRGAAGALLIRV